MDQVLAPRRKPRSLALELVDALGDRIRDGRLAPGDKLPTEAAIMGEFGVSRTVVREAISKLQASGLVQTRHGVGTFAVGMGEAAPFRIRPDQLATLRDVIAVLEVRIGLETEAAGLAAGRRTATNLAAMREALDAFAQAIEAGTDSVGADFQFHLEIARATQNAALRRPAERVRPQHHPACPARRRRRPPTRSGWRTCGASTASTRASTTPSPARTPTPRARPCARTWRTAASGAGAPRRSARAPDRSLNFDTTSG